MPYVLRRGWPLWLLVGLIAGVLIGQFWPHTPLHAVATDRLDNYAIATGPVDEETEAVFFLDFLTGTLKAAVLSRDARTPKFRAFYEANINADLARTITVLNAGRGGGGRKGRGAVGMPGMIQTPQSPNYLMVTGGVHIQATAAQGRTPPGRCVVYVAETNTGIVMAYVIPWSPQDASANRISGGQMLLWTADQFSSAIVRQTNE
jgi:hypothetical protein